MRLIEIILSTQSMMYGDFRLISNASFLLRLYWRIKLKKLSPLCLEENVSTFYPKRKDVLIKTLRRFTSNARAFHFERKGVWSVLKIAASLKINSWLSWQVDGLAGIFTTSIIYRCGTSHISYSTPIYIMLEKPVPTRQPVKRMLV